MRKILSLCFISLCAWISLTACSFTPTYYSKNEVKNYVNDIFGNEYSLSDSHSYADEEEGTMIYEYIFTNKEDFSFSVKSYTDHVSFISGETVFYEKCISDDFLTKMAELHMAEIQSVIYSVPFEVKQYNLGVSCYLEDYTQIPDVAKLIVELDTILDLEYEYTNWKETKSNATYYIYVRLKPNTVDYIDVSEETWHSTTKYEIHRITLSHSEEDRFSLDETIEDIQRSLVYDIRSATETSPAKYEIPDELLYKFPAQKLTIEIEEDTELSYNFYYDVEDEKYWIYNLDPCQNFEGSYNYGEKGAFEELVEIMGGTYKCDDWEASWQIGEDTWKATLEIDNNSRYKDFTVWKNGMLLKLDEPNEKNNGTVSGRAFSVSDLEKMLDITFEENQIDATISYNKE
ncbi:MAG: hypothetical protein R3Y58_11515 [Eubacteriales bacterium]